jgi:hypothetical protein
VFESARGVSLTDRVREECKKKADAPCPGNIAILSWECEEGGSKLGAVSEEIAFNSELVDQPCNEVMSNMRKCMSDEPDRRYGGLNSIEAMLKPSSVKNIH